MQVIKLEYNGKTLYQIRKMVFDFKDVGEISKTFIIGVRIFNKAKNKKIFINRIDVLNSRFTEGVKRKQCSFYMNESQYKAYLLARDNFQCLLDSVSDKVKCNECDLFLLLGKYGQNVKL